MERGLSASMQIGRLKRNIALAAAAVLSAGALAGCGVTSARSKPPLLPPLAVSVQTVRLSRQTIGNIYLGVVTPYIQTTLSPSAAGQLAQLNVRAGQAVHAGELLAALSPSALAPQQNAAQEAGAALAGAERQYADELALYRDNSGAEQQVAAARNAVREQAAARKTASVNLRKAELEEQAVLSGGAATPQDAAALQAALTADRQALASAKQQLGIARSSLSILKQTLAAVQQEFGSVTEAKVQQASQTYQDALSHYQSWQRGAFTGQNPYAANVQADGTIYQNLNGDYSALAQGQQQYNQGAQAVIQAENAVSGARAQLANAEKNAADAAPPATDSNAARQAEAGVAAAQAALNQAQVQYGAAVSSWKLTRQIARDKTQARASLDSAANAVNQERTAVQAARRALQVQEQGGRVVAPVSGVVQAVGAQVGEQVGPQTQLVTIASIRPQMVTADVPEPDIGKLQKGAAVYVHVPSLGETFGGRVLDIHPELNQTTNEYPVDILINGDHPQLLPGMQAAVRVRNSSTAKVMLVPADAVLSLQSGAQEVFIESGGRVRSQIVQVGAMSSTVYEITGGLRAGERIVVQGQNLLSDGDRVKVVAGIGAGRG